MSLRPFNHRTHRMVVVTMLFVLSLGALLLVRQTPLLARDQHLVWSVESAEGRVTLMGSIHTLRRDEYPLPRVYKRAYAQATGLVFETDMVRMHDPATQSRLMALGLYPKGEALRDHLSSNAYEALARALSQRGLPPEQFSRFKPWFCAFTLVMLELQRLGYSPRNGLDMHFFTKAGEDGKDLFHLEPVEEQIRLLASLEQEGAQEDFLLQSLQELKILESKASQMTQAWRTGDADGLQQIIQMSFEGFPDLYERFITRRNQEWLPSIEGLIRDGRDVLVIVGAGHLVGSEGIIQMLRDRGHHLEQQ